MFFINDNGAAPDDADRVRALGSVDFETLKLLERSLRDNARCAFARWRILKSVVDRLDPDQKSS